MRVYRECVGRVSDSVTRHTEHHIIVGLRLSPNPTYKTTKLQNLKIHLIINRHDSTKTIN